MNCFVEQSSKLKPPRQERNEGRVRAMGWCCTCMGGRITVERGPLGDVMK